MGRSGLTRNIPGGFRQGFPFFRGDRYPRRFLDPRGFLLGEDILAGLIPNLRNGATFSQKFGLKQAHHRVLEGLGFTRLFRMAPDNRYARWQPRRAPTRV